VIVSTSVLRRTLGLMVIGVTLTACGGTPGTHNATGGRTTTSTSAFRPYPGVDPGHIVPAGPGPTTLPTEDAITPIYPQFNTGQQVVITAHGFEPHQLNATTGEAVVWTNVSGVPQRVVISEEHVRSPTIPPGAQFVWTWKLGGNINVQTASGFVSNIYYQD
jgi:hypothetical protein